ncbi:hypothetical protein GH714_020267 [Hevea brasiliensis]|uniref:BSD domain-containing protein n=1 Tax=Hevea brasiliensis TaxID=3981 RepID=A0A6A6L0F2_HEVBR|nr:hypothetical protein GH714_020267 [Hevea brasiliensis]
MDFWRKAQAFAEDAAKRSQELTKEAAKRSQEFTIGSSKLSDIVSETAKRSKEIAAEASKRSQEITIGSSKLSTSYEKRYMEEAMQKSAEQVKDNVVEEKAMATSKPEVKKSNHESKTLTSSSAEQDLDIFLLGGDSDEGPGEELIENFRCSNDLSGFTDDGEGDFDDFDKMVDSSDEEKGKL